MKGEAMNSARWGLAILAALAARPSAASDKAEDPSRKARQAAIAQTIVAIDAEVKQYGGGTWETWAETLKPFRQALASAKTAKDNWSFRDQDRQLLQLDTLDGLPDGQRPFDAFLHFDRQLKAKGIDLIVVLIPDKTAIYPDYLVKDVPCDRLISIQVKHLMKKLSENDVEVVDLYTAYRDYRLKDGDKHHLYYDTGDTHWRNLGCQIAAEKIGERLKRYDFVQKALAAGNPYVGKPFRREDAAQPFKNDDVLLIETKDGGKYQDDPRSPVLVTSCSYGYYNVHLRSHITGQIARHVGIPLSLLFKMGPGGHMMGEVKRAGNLANRRVVVYTTIARCLLGKWEKVNL
jgi:hypothetical protein